MIFEFRQQNSGGTGQKGMPLVIYVVAEYAHDANRILQQNDGYFGRREGDCPEIGSSCCGDRWEPVEQADGFEDEDFDDILSEIPENQKVWHSNTFINEEPFNGIEEFWVIRNI